CFQRAAAVENKDDFIGASVLIILELAVSLRGSRPVGSHVGVEEHRDAAGVKVAAPWNVSSLDVVVAERALRYFLRRPILDQLHLPHASRWPKMIDNRVSFVETLGSNNVLVRSEERRVGKE